MICLRHSCRQSQASPAGVRELSVQLACSLRPAAWQQWHHQYGGWDQQQQPPVPPAPAERPKPDDPYNLFEGPLNQLVEHTRKVEEDQEKLLEESEEMWESIEESRWWQPDQ